LVPFVSFDENEVSVLSLMFNGGESYANITLDGCKHPA
jgi:hypothetical protein